MKNPKKGILLACIRYSGSELVARQFLKFIWILSTNNLSSRLARVDVLLNCWYSDLLLLFTQSVARKRIQTFSINIIIT